MMTLGSAKHRAVYSISFALAALVVIGYVATALDDYAHHKTLKVQLSEHRYEPHASLGIDELIHNEPGLPESTMRSEQAFQTEGYYWYSFEPSEIDTQYERLKIEFAWLDTVQLVYLYENGKSIEFVAGDDERFDKRSISFRKPTFPIVRNLDGSPLHKGFIRVSAQGYASLPLTAMSAETFQHQSNLDHLFYGAWLAILFALGLYNAAIFFTLRDNVHVFYIAYVLSYASLLMIASGMGQHYLWPRIEGLTTQLAHTALALTNATTVWFVSRFLSLSERHQKIDRILKQLAIVSVISVPFTFFFGYTALNIILLCSFIIMFMVISTSVLATLQGNLAAPFLLASYTVLVPSNAIALLRFMGLYEDAYWAEHLAELGFVTEALILSFGLAFRINQLKRNNDMLALASEKERTLFAKQVIAIKEEERKNIGKALHDSLGHKILAIKNAVRAIDQPDGGRFLNEAETMLDETLNEVRDISHLLYPSILEHIGLQKSISAMARRSLDSTSIDYSLDVEALNLEHETNILLYRAAQESISNLLKHSDADRFSLSINMAHDSKSVFFVAQDSGPSPLSSDDMGFGLRALYKHVMVLGGQFKMGRTTNHMNYLSIEVTTAQGAKS